VDLARRLPEQAPEAPRVVEAQDAAFRAPAVGEFQVDVVVRFHRRVARQDAQAAGHAQVEERAADFGVEQQVFRSPTNGIDPPTGEQGRYFRRNRPAQIRTTQHDVGDDAPFNMRCEAAPRGFDFGQFGHGVSLRDSRRL
jgi:hypothetical protein